jgi:enterobactin synthetase component F
VPLLSVRDVSTAADPAAAARSLMHADRLSPVDPTRDRISQQVLLDLGGQRWVWYLRVHHLAADGYGMALFTDRVCALYAGRMGEPLPGLAGVLADDAAYRADPRRALAGQWWREHMQGAPAGVGLAGTLAASDDALRWVQPLDAAFREQLLQASVRWLQPWPDVLAALSAEYLRRMSAADEVVLGVPYMGRLGNASARVPAMVMNVLPLRVAAGEGSVEAFTRGLGRQLSQGRKHGRYRGEQLRRDLGLVGAQQRLHGPLVNVQPFYKPLALAGVQATLEVLCTGPVDDLTLGFRGDGQRLLDLEIEANPALYSREDVEAHAARLLHFVSAALQADDIAAVPLATPRRRSRCCTVSMPPRTRCPRPPWLNCCSRAWIGIRTRRAGVRRRRAGLCNAGSAQFRAGRTAAGDGRRPGQRGGGGIAALAGTGARAGRGAARRRGLSSAGPCPS